MEKHPPETLERIVPRELEIEGATGRATYELHLQRYSFAVKHLRGSTVLDIACGVGYGTSFLVENYRQITSAHGVDISEHAIAYARENYANRNIQYLCEDAMKFRGLGAYDSITSLETIEHVPNPVSFLKHITHLLRPGGVLVASVPTTPSMDGNPHHRTDFTERSFRRLGSSMGLKEIGCLVQSQPFELRRVLNGQEQRLERTPRDLLAFYATHPLKLPLRFWALLRFGFVNKYLTVAWEKPRSVSGE